MLLPIWGNVHFRAGVCDGCIDFGMGYTLKNHLSLLKFIIQLEYF